MKAFRDVQLELAERVEAYEVARQGDDSVDVAHFLPEADHPHHGLIGLELLRVDLEYAWNRGQRQLLDTYLDRFPQILSNPEHRNALAFEEYRLRHAAGERIERRDYEQQYGVETREWPDLGRESSDSRVAGYGERHERLEDESLTSSLRVDTTSIDDLPPIPGRMARLPEPGEKWLGFRFIAQIGQGAFSHVYLAQQDILAQRFVILKLSQQRWAEADVLARLQHTNIVPIYSVHRSARLQIVCMPFLGFCTLADILKSLFHRGSAAGPRPASGAELLSTVANHRADTIVSSLSGTGPEIQEQIERHQAAHWLHSNRWAERLQHYSYVEACLWLVSEIADGLAHAHQMGILHRDLKPANILITDDGRPMLLDFNLSEDLTADSWDTAIGGTIPYMAPEHLRALQSKGYPDAQSDIYSVGVMLYELLTGQRPFPDRTGALDRIMPELIRDRLEAPVPVRAYVPNVPRAVEAIVAKCIAPMPNDRYASALDLREDLLRQLNHEPLRHAPNRSLIERAGKWAKRHPRWSSASTVALLAGLVAVLAGGIWYTREQANRTERARGLYAHFQEEFQATRLALSAPEIDQGLADESLAQAAHFFSHYPAANVERLRALDSFRRLTVREQVAIERQYGEISQLANWVAQRQERLAADDSERVARRLDAEQWHEKARNFGAEFRASIQAGAPNTGTHDPWTRMVVGAEQPPRGFRPEADAPTPTSLPSIEPHTFYTIYWNGLSALESARWLEACRLFDQAVEIEPRDFAAWFARGKAYAAIDNMSQAITCFTTCAALRSESWLPFYHRGLAHYQMQHYAEAEADFERVLKRRPTLTSALINRALAQQKQGQHADALATIDGAMQAGSGETRIHFLRAESLRSLNRTSEAQAAQKLGLELTPRDELSWVARGMAQLPTAPQRALADLAEALKLNPHSYIGLRNSSYIYSDLLQQIEPALECLHKILVMRPHDIEMRAARGVLHARRGAFDEARADATAVLADNPSPRTMIHAACIYARTMSDRPEDKVRALELIRQALRHDPRWAAELLQDVDLASLANDQEFKEVVAKAKALWQESDSVRMAP